MAEPRSKRLLPLLALVVAVAFLVLGTAWVQPGPISIDEGIYELMARAWASGDGHTIRNGYEAFPSKELWFQVLDNSPQVSEHGGRLVAKYPPFLAVLAAPLYPLLDFRALFLLNAIAFVGACGLLWALARELLDDPAVAWLSVALFAGATYAVDYALAAWPHMLAVASVLGGVLLVLRSMKARAAAWRGALAAGLVLGLGVGLRLDVILALGLVGLLVLAGPGGWRSALAFGLGTLPGLALLSWANLAKFGVFFPLYYTSTDTSLVRGMLPYVSGLALLVLVRWGVSLGPAQRWLGAHRRWLWWLLPAGLVLVLALPPLRHRAWSLVVGLRDLGWDLRCIRMNPEAEYNLIMPRSPSGALLYLGGVKKALLQSMPWLPLLLLPVVAGLRERRGALGLPLLVAAAFLLPFALSSWHGGQSLNLRYFAPGLPFVALLGGWALRRVADGLGPRWPWGALAAAVLAGLAFAALLPPAREQQAAHELLLLDAPLVLASLTALSALVAILRSSRTARTALLLVAGLGLGWSGAVAWGYDLALSHGRRGANLSVATEVAAQIPDDALLVITVHEPFYPMGRFQPVIIANPSFDGGADFPALVRHHLAGGRPVYGAMPREGWAQLQAAGLFEGLEVRPGGNAGQFLVGEIGWGAGQSPRQGAVAP